MIQMKQMILPCLFLCDCFFDQLENTVLLIAAKEGHVEIVRLLLEHGANVNEKNNRVIE